MKLSHFVWTVANAVGTTTMVVMAARFRKTAQKLQSGLMGRLYHVVFAFSMLGIIQFVTAIGIAEGFDPDTASFFIPRTFGWLLVAATGVRYIAYQE